MPFPQSLRSQAFVAGFIGLTALPGAWSFATAPLLGLGTDILKGSVQRNYETRFEDSFPLQDALRQGWAALQYAALGEVAEGAIATRDGILFTAEEFTSPAPHPDFATALLAARKKLAATGADLIPIIVPDKARMMAASLPRARSAHFEARYDRLLDVIAQTGLRTVDLRPILDAPGSFLATDTHWSPEGARTVAAAIATLLEGHVARGAGFETSRIGTRELQGDLLAFVDTGVWRHWSGPPLEEIARYETHAQNADALGLFDDVHASVTLVGTSFSAREDLHFVGFLKSAIGADVVSFAMEGRGPFVPMDRFLQTETPPENAPQFVLWEIPERYLNTWSLDQ